MSCVDSWQSSLLASTAKLYIETHCAVPNKDGGTFLAEFWTSHDSMEKNDTIRFIFTEPMKDP